LGRNYKTKQMNIKSILNTIFLITILHWKLLGQEPMLNEIKLPDEIKSINDLLFKNGILYVATAQGLYTCSDTILNRFYEEENKSAYHINTLCADRAGNLWFGTYNGLLVKFSNKKVEKVIDIKPFCITDNFLISSISIDTVYENKNTEILLSTSGGELFGYDTLKQVIRKIESPVRGTIFSIRYGILPAKWLCSTDGFFTMSKNKKWKKNSGYFTVYQIVENNGKYWGIGRDKDKKAMFMLYYDENGDNEKFHWQDFDLKQLTDKYLKFNNLAFISGEIALILTDNGLMQYNPTNASINIVAKSNGIDLKKLQYIAIGQNGEIWLASSGRRLIKATFK